MDDGRGAQGIVRRRWGIGGSRAHGGGDVADADAVRQRDQHLRDLLQRGSIARVGGGAAAGCVGGSGEPGLFRSGGGGGPEQVGQRGQGVRDDDPPEDARHSGGGGGFG